MAIPREARGISASTSDRTPTYGFFVVGTSHDDVDENCTSGVSGNSELAEQNAANLYRFFGFNVTYDGIIMWNPVNNPQVYDWNQYNGTHYWNNDGWATMIYES
jgi:hypothetical protein